ncbi:MAG: hypothetical protein LAN70_15685 [Acidobacteriia bacterium]|nr:hypothetical protein [Terriglobia bacterium]
MNGKPKSHRASILAASYCTHPDIDAADSMLFVCLAAYADYGTGSNSRPGNESIQHAMKLTNNPSKIRITKNIERGLIERTFRANGRKQASIYRLCFESPHFPDQAPNGEWLIEKPDHGDDPDKTGPWKPNSGQKPDHESAETGPRTQLNRTTDQQKPDHSCGTHNKRAIEEKQRSNSCAAPSPSSHVEKQKPSTLVETFYGECLRIWRAKHGEKAGLLFPTFERKLAAQLLERHGMELVLAKFQDYIKPRNDPKDTCALLHFIGKGDKSW